ncbi:collectin-10 [Elysia marginata]|uniref:Collectin-10 n=1 Tax=Elysia marginata TaxID=1093978 RepID=A0AAV4JJI9_9GAST|nr:collectin-10 [Elysia marginata]
MGIIGAVTPGEKRSRPKHRDTSLKANQISTLGQIPVHFYNSSKTEISLRYEELQDFRLEDVTTKLDLLWKVSWPLRTPNIGWSGLMQAVLEGNFTSSISGGDGAMILCIGGVFLLALAVQCDAQSTVDTVCPPNSVTLYTRYYLRATNETCFLFRKHKTTYANAALGCARRKAFLAMPKTKDVNDFLLREMSTFDELEPMWIGMQDQGEEGRYMWTDGSPVDDWGNFAKGNGGLFGGSEDCLALDPRDGKWHDYGCNTGGLLGFIGISKMAKLPYICQFP